MLYSLNPIEHNLYRVFCFLDLTMKLRVLSDLHLEGCAFNPPEAECDAVILAGDIGTGTLGITWAANNFEGLGVPVIYVPGNHEFYGWDMYAWERAAKIAAKERGIILGDHTSTLIEKEGEQPVRVLSATLWTDFALYGPEKVGFCGDQTQRCLYDYTAIKRNQRLLTWRAVRHLSLHTQRWLKEKAALAKAAGEKVVVATHHAPSELSSAPRFKNDPVTAGFASNLEAFAEEFVDCWIHGHMHNNSWYKIGKCLVVANPRGYRPPSENPRFDDKLVIEV
jgi:predicted phosphodiesterase